MANKKKKGTTAKAIPTNDIQKDESMAGIEEEAEKITKNSPVDPIKDPGRRTNNPQLDVIREPNPNMKKMVVVRAGQQEEPGSISELAEKLGCTRGNISQHIKQCHSRHGYGTETEGDNFRILGEPTETWDDQIAKKQVILDKKRVTKKAEIESEVKKKKDEKAETSVDLGEEDEISSEDDNLDFLED